MISKSTYVESLDTHKWLITTYRLFGLTIYKRATLLALLHQYPHSAIKI